MSFFISDFRWVQDRHVLPLWKLGMTSNYCCRYNHQEERHKEKTIVERVKMFYVKVLNNVD